MTVSVYRSSRDDSSNRGLTASHDTLTVVNVDGPFEPSEDAPAVLLVQGPGSKPNPILIPAELVDTNWAPIHKQNLIGPMCGGTYGGTIDARWTKAIRALGGIDLARIHDRFETPEMLSR